MGMLAYRHNLWQNTLPVPHIYHQIALASVRLQLQHPHLFPLPTVFQSTADASHRTTR